MNPSFTRRHFLKNAATATIGLTSIVQAAEDRRDQVAGLSVSDQV